MVDAVLSSRFTNYEVVPVPDFGHILDFEDGKEWTRYVTTQFESIDAFVTDNPWCIKLLEEQYTIVKPTDLIASEKQVATSSTMVRQAIVSNGDYTSLVPEPVAVYMQRSNLDERLQKEFGEEILATLGVTKPYGTETVEEEMRRVKG